MAKKSKSTQSMLQIRDENGAVRKATTEDFYWLVDQKKREQAQEAEPRRTYKNTTTEEFWNQVEQKRREQAERKKGALESVPIRNSGEGIQERSTANAFRASDFGYNVFKNRLMNEESGTKSTDRFQALQKLGSPEKIIDPQQWLGSGWNQDAGRQYTPQNSLRAGEAALRRLAEERAAVLSKEAGIGESSGKNEVMPTREITDSFFQELLGDGADQQKQRYAAFLMRDPELIGSMSTEELGMLKKSAEKYADEMDKDRWMKSAKLAEMEENGAMPEELEEYQNEIDQLKTMSELWRDGAQRLEWQKNIAGRQEQIATTEAGARSAADFDQVAEVGGSRGKSLSEGEAMQYNMWLLYGRPNGISYQEYWAGHNAWDTENRPVQRTRQQKKADEIMMGMMADETARAKDAYDASQLSLQLAQSAYDAALAEYDRAEKNYYEVPDGDFQKAMDDYLNADEALKEAEEKLEQAKKQSEEGSKEEKKRLQQAEKDEAEVKKLLSLEKYPNRVGGNVRKGAEPEEPNPLEFYLAYKDSEMAQRTMPEGIQALVNYAGMNNWDRATQEQREVFAYLWETDRESASEYLKQIQVELSKEAMDEMLTNQKKDWENMDFWGKTGENLLSNVYTVAGGAAAGLYELVSIMTGNQNVYNKAMWAQQKGAMTRKLTSEDIYKAVGYDPKSGKEPNFWQSLLVNGYNAIGSAVDSALGVALFQMGYTAIMGAGSAAQKAQELYERGASDAEITMGALASGGLETFFEYVSLEKIINLQDGEGLKTQIINALKSAGVEASEELFTEIGNQVAESILFAANSNIKDREDYYIAQGKTLEEAKRMAMRDAAMDNFWAAYGGFISGGAFSMTGVPRMVANKARGVVSDIRKNTETRKTGETILRNEGGNELIDTARKNGVPDELVKLAVEKTADDLQKMSWWQQRKAGKAMGKLHEATLQAQTEKASQALKDSFQEAAAETIRQTQEQQQTGEENQDIQNQQKEKTPEEVNEAAQAAKKEAFGEELTEQEKRVVKELGGEEFISKVANSREFQENAARRTEGIIQQMEDTASLARDTTKQKEIVRRFAQENGMDETVMLSSMKRTQDGAQFASAWESAYQMGAGGIDLRYAQRASANRYLTQQQIETAYMEGRKVYDEEIGKMDLPEGGQWNDRADSGREIRTVEAGAAAEGYQKQQGAGGWTAAAAEKISPIELGIPNGSSNKKVYRVLEEAYDADTKAAYQKARDNGLKFVAYRGGAIETFENVNGRQVLVKSRGLVVNGTMYVRVDDNTFTASQIAGHEAAHEQIRRGEIDVEAVKEWLLERYDQQEIDAIIDLYSEAYGDSGLTAEEVLEEIICDAMGQMNAFATKATERIAGEVGVFLRDVEKAAKQEGGQKKNATGDGGVKMSREMFTEEAKAFSEEISLWEREGKASGQSFIMGSTGEVLQGLGAIESDIYINGDKINNILKEHPEITIDEIKKIPNILNEPALILKSRNVGRNGSQNTRMVIYGSVKGKNGLPMMVVFDIRPMENHLVIDDMQKVVSAYTKTNDGVSFVKNSFVLYADKKRATSLLRSIGFQMPIELRQSGYIGSISYKQRSVNFYGEKFSDVFGQNSTENKHSREMDTQKALERQNEILRKRVEYWKEQTRTRKNIGKKADAAQVRKLGRKLLREYSSDTSLEEILPELQRLADQKDDYSKMSELAQTVARRILEGSGVDVNGELAEERKALKKYLWSTPINITESIKAGIPDFAEWKKQNRGLRFREDGSGTDVDSMWLELQDDFGFGMFPEDIMNPEDQVRYIADQLNDMREDIQNPYAKDMEFSVQQAAMEILNGAMEIDPEEMTRADMAVEKATEEMRQLLEEGRARERKRVENAKKTDARQKIKTISEKFKRMATKPGKGASQHAPERLKKTVVDFCELFTDSELRRMDRWQRSLEYRADEIGRKMGTVMNQTLINEFNTIESQQARKDRVAARLSDLRSAYAKMQNDGEFQTVYDETVAKMIETVEGILKEKDLYQLDAYELRQVQNAVTGLYYTITNANKAFSMGKDKSISDMAQKMAREIRQTNPKQAGMGMLFRRYLQWQMSPDTYFSYLCGFIKDNEGKVIQDGFRKGSERMMGVKRDFYQMFREFTESKDSSVQKELKQLMNYNEKELVSWGLKDLEGNEVQTTRGMMLQAYMLLNQRDSFDSLRHGGFTVPNMKRYYQGDHVGSYGDALETTIYSESPGQGFAEMVQRNKDIQARMEALQQKIEIAETESYRQRYQMELNELEAEMMENRRKMEAISNQAAEKLLNMVKAIEEQMTPLEKKLIAKAHEWYSYSGKLMSDVFLQMYGFKPKLVESYVQIHRDTTTIKTDIRNMADAEKAFNLENSGFTIERVKNSQPILLTDFFDELNRQSDKMGRYVGFAQVQKDFGKIWKTRVDSRGMTVNTLVRARFGAGKTALGVSGEEYINHYIADVAGGHSSDDILGTFYGNYAAATLRFNPRVAVSQAASIPTMASVVGWKSMAVGFAKGLPKSWSTKYRNELAAKNVWFYQRYRGQGGSTELSEISRKGNIIETIANSSVGKKLFNWCQEVDVWATGSIMWSAAEDYVQRQGIQNSSPEYEAAVNQIYTDIIRKSQPNYTVTERSDLLRDNRSHMKLLTMFKTQSNQNFNLLLEANGEYIRMKQDFKNGRNGVTEEDVKQAGKKLANASTGVLIGGTAAFVALRTIMNFILAAVDPYRDEETDEVTMEAALKGIGKEILSSLAGTVALGGQVYDLVMPIVTGEKYYGLSDSAVSTLSSMLENTITVLQNGKETTRNQLWKAANSWCMALGIPANNAKKIIDMILTYADDIRNGRFGQFTSSKTTKKQYQARLVQHYQKGEMDKAADALSMLKAKSEKDTDKEVKKEIASGMRECLKDLYEAGDISESEAQKLMEYTGTEDPKKYTAKWDFQLEHPEYDNPGDSMIAAYNQRGDIDGDVFLEAWYFNAAAVADKDKDGKSISGSKKQKVVEYIQGIPGLSYDQEKKLFELLNVGSVKGTPWE